MSLALRDYPRPILEALRHELAPAWANDAQRTFYWSHAPELLYSGAMGAGKSRILTEKAWRLALKLPRRHVRHLPQGRCFTAGHDAAHLPA